MIDGLFREYRGDRQDIITDRYKISNAYYTMCEDIQYIFEIPNLMNCSYSLSKSGTCLEEQVGVKAPGTEKITTFLFSKRQLLVVSSIVVLETSFKETEGTNISI